MSVTVRSRVTKPYSRNEEGIVLSSDLDGSTLFIDAWGFTALEDEDELFDLIWTATREYH